MAVYTEVPDDELAAFMARYPLGEVRSLKGIAEGVENSNFLLATDTGQYILTLYEKRMAEAELPFFLGLMDHLAGKGISCPLPVHDRDGNALNRLAGRPAAIVTWLEGVWVRRPTTDHCRAVGEALAAMHLAGRDYTVRRDNSLGIAGWRPLFEGSREGADSVRAGLASDIGHELDALEAAWPEDLPAGVIHADLFPDNVFFLRGELSGLIDFYFACNDTFAYDLGICLNAWCFEGDGAFNVTKSRALIRGYRSVRPLSEAELTSLPILARGSALRFLLTRLHDWLRVPEGALVVPKDPLEFYQKMCFHRSADEPSAYGIDP